MSSRILVIGGTGALGTYLVPALLGKGYRVDVISLDEVSSDNCDCRYIRMDAKDLSALEPVVRSGYDGIVDLLIYPRPAEFAPFLDLFLSNTGHYVFMSTYRVYAGSWPITEESPRLLDVSTDQRLLASGDYSIYKAQEEDMIRADGRHTVCSFMEIFPTMKPYSVNSFFYAKKEWSIGKPAIFSISSKVSLKLSVLFSLI